MYANTETDSVMTGAHVAYMRARLIRSSANALRARMLELNELARAARVDHADAVRAARLQEQAATIRRWIDANETR